MPSIQIKIDYTIIDGAHFFTSKDKLALGLCAAHNDFDVAMDDILTQLGVLLANNHGINLIG